MKPTGKNVLRIVLAAALLLMAFSMTGTPAASADGDDEYTYFVGTLVKVEYGPWAPWGRKAVLHLKTPKEDSKTITIQAGFKTEYEPYRTPEKGDRVNVKCIHSDGAWAAVRVRYQD